MPTTPSIGVSIPPTPDAASFPAAIDAARRIEDAGLDHVSFADVVLGDGQPVAEPLALAAAVAAATSSVRLEFGVLAVTLRPVPVLAAQLHTLQHLSGGRVIAGLGIGGFPDAPLWVAAGAATRGRARQLENALRVLPPLLGGDAVHVRPDTDAVQLAPPAPVPLFVIGGGDSDIVLDRVARLADGWFPSLLAPDRLAAGAESLRARAAELGRPRPTVRYATHAALGPDADEQARLLHGWIADYGLDTGDVAGIPVRGPAPELAERLAALGRAGADSVTLVLDGADWPGQLAVVAAARDLLADGPVMRTAAVRERMSGT